MNKVELARSVAGRVPGLSVVQAEQMVDAVVDSIVASVARGDSVTLKNFGVFTCVLRKGRVGVGPTGLKWAIKERRVPVFRPGKDFREEVE